jgi:hypothetical protein
MCDTPQTSGVEVGANFGAELSIKAANVKDPANELLDLKIAVDPLWTFGIPPSR